MAQEIVMPKLGLTMTEGTIEAWKVKEGQAFKQGDVLFSVATDKLTNDVEAERDGVLLKIIRPEGSTAACREIVAWIGEAGEAVPESAPKAKETEDTIRAADEKPAATAERKQSILASPAAKKLAKERNIDLALLTGTGPKGRITLEDVESYVPPSEEKVKMSPVAEKIAKEFGVDVGSLEAEGRVMKADVFAALSAGQTEEESNDFPAEKVSLLRSSIAGNMLASWTTSPRVTYVQPVDATAMMELRNLLKERMMKQGVKLTYNHILIKVVAKVLTEFPDVNASFADNMLTRHRHVNMGLAVAKEGGLVVPNIKRCEEKSLMQIAGETEDLIQRTRENKIVMEDITGGTFTITNLGRSGITAFSPIINQPELAILGVCDMIDTPVVREGIIVIRPMMNLTLTADHRVIDGVHAASFLNRIVECLENPLLLIV